MFAFFDTVAIAFAIAFALYELNTLMWAIVHRLTTDHRIRRCTSTGRMFIDENAVRWSAATVLLSMQRTYMSRSVLFHQLNAWLAGGKPEFHSLPHFGLGLMGACMFYAAGLPGLTALGLGVVGGVTGFINRQGRNFACLSDETSDRDDQVRNLQLVLMMRRDSDRT